MKFPPVKILIESDDTEIEFVRQVLIDKNKAKGYVYRYTKSNHSMGKEITFTEEALKKQLRNFFKPIIGFAIPILKIALYVVLS